MKQDLEKYLKEKRSRLDVEEAETELIWEGIRSGLHKKKYKLPEWFWKVAAILIFMVLATYFVMNETSKKQVVIVTLADISKDLGEQEARLKMQVKLKWDNIQNQILQENADYQFLLVELSSLDEIYTTYQKDLNSTLDNEPVIRAMLDYYEKKIRILNRLLLEIEKRKHHETITL